MWWHSSTWVSVELILIPWTALKASLGSWTILVISCHYHYRIYGSCSIHERNRGNSEPTLTTSYRWHLFYHNQAELHHKTKGTYFLYSPLHFCSYFYVVYNTSWEERNCHHECVMEDKRTWVSLQDKHFSCFLWKIF